MKCKNCKETLPKGKRLPSGLCEKCDMEEEKRFNKFLEECIKKGKLLVY